MMDTKYLLECLRNTAEEESEEGEYDISEHASYIAAKLIESLLTQNKLLLTDLVAVLHGYKCPSEVMETLILEDSVSYCETLRAIKSL